MKMTTKQRKSIFGLAKKVGMNAETLALAVSRITGNPVQEGHTGIAAMGFDDANKLIRELGGTEHRHESKRTAQHRRRKAGIKAIATKRQLNYINFLAGERGWSDEALAAFCQRQIKKTSPTTTKEANAVIEALKAMAARPRNAA